jgi:protease IV
MTLSADHVVDRRRLRRKLTFWRIVAIATALASLVAIGFILAGRGSQAGSKHIARVKIEGMITGKQETLDVLREVERSSAAALVLRINSGGGTTSGSEALYNEVRRISAKKPVIAVIDGVGASGAYMTALGAERIVANGSAIIGSIGVIAQYPNLVKLLDTLGVKVESVRSSPLKAQPSGVEPTPPEARAALEASVGESYAWFRGLVGERRKLEGEALGKVADGRVFTGRQAIGLKLIDQIGDERDAITWLEAEKGLEKGLAVREYKPKSQQRGLPSLTALAALARMFGIEVSPNLSDAPERLMGMSGLDGLVSVWHPSQE